MSREYIRVTPSRSELAPRTVTQQLLGLHSLGTDSRGILSKLNPLTRDPPPTFEFLAISEGNDEPVEFYYGTDDRLDALEERLRTLYPATFTIDRVELDLRTKLIPPIEYDRDEYEKRREGGRLLEPDDDTGVEQTAAEPAPPVDQEMPVGDGGATPDENSGQTPPLFDGPDEAENTPISSEFPESDQIETSDSEPASVRARPSLDEVDPMGVSWYGSMSRREDWMTTIPQFTGTDRDENEHSRAPLAQLIDQLTRTEHPIAFQVLFRRKSDWSHAAMERKRKLREGEDRLIDWFFGEVLGDPEQEEHSPSNTGRQRQYLDIGGRERVESIDEKDPQHTYTVNLRALALATEETDKPRLTRRLDDLQSVFDHLNGAHYRVVPKRLRRGLRKASRARQAATRIFDRTIVSSRWRKTRPELVLGPAELANFVVVPPSTELTTEGGRGSEAEPESRSPLPLPSQEHMRAFTGTGMAIGHGLDEDGDPLPDPVRIPPHLLPFHIGRFAKTGAGKSVALLNDALSLYDQTDGPVFLIDSKGGNLPEHYMRAHAKRFGVEDLEENVVHFAVPEILPGFAFFDIQPALETGVSRVDAVQDKADHYEEIIKLVMGPERYEEAVAAPNLIKYLIKAMYDEEHGLENGHFREDVDYFTHDQLEHAVTQFHAAGPPNPTPEDAPQSSEPQVAEKLKRHLRSNPATFANVVSGISNRMDYITQDAHLRRIFNNTESQFDFRELLDDDQVVIFDLGDLRDDAARAMTGVILTELYDAIKRRDGETLAENQDDYVANLLIDEASSVVISDTLTTLLEKGREFQLSIELVTQFPEQMKEAGDREVYLNVLNNIGSPLVGKIAVDADIAEALAHEAMDPVEFKNRISSLPRGEWIAQLPSPEFGETGPDPFSVDPLPIPPGHPDSDEPLTGYEEKQFQDALETVHEATQAEYGVPEESTIQNRDAAADVRLENGDDQPLEVAMATAIRAVQISQDTRETNGWVPVDVVDQELLTRVDEDELEARGYDALPDVREASTLIEVDLPDDATTVMCRLTAEGEDAAAPDTSSDPTGGGESHDAALDEIERVLTAYDFSVHVLDQTGEERPDAIATHPEVEETFSVEVETTTHTRPAKVLTNLQRAQAADHIPLFVVRGDGTAPGTDIAERIANILSDPYNRLSTGETRLYTTNDNVTFHGGARASDGVTAVRPATDGSRRTRWVQRDNDLVLADDTGDEHARLTDFEHVSKDQFPATYSYDDDAGTYTVFTPGELPDTYESKEAFEADWVPVKRPFVPVTDLPVPDYGTDSFAIVVLKGQDGDATASVYEPTDGTLRELTTLIEDVHAGDLHPAGMTVPQSTDDHSETGPVDEDEYGIGAFAASYLREDDDALVAVADVYRVYQQFVENSGYDEKPKTRFTPALKNHVDTESKRKYLDGDTRRCYVGIELVDDAAP